MEYATFILASLTAIVGMTEGATRIIGGELADVKDFPYFVRIERDTSRSTWDNCGGTLLNPRFVVTAHHCVSEKPNNPVANKYSSYRIFVAPTHSYDYQFNHGPFSLVEEIISHPEARIKNNAHGFLQVSENDIAIIKLKKEPSNLPSVYPKLPTSQPAPGTEGVVVGLGVTDGQYKRKIPLLRLNEYVVDDDTCRRMAGSVQTVGTLCATSLKSSAACRGDSGGPFVSVDQDGAPTLYGVVSFGSSQCREHDVYADVSKYVSWIQQVTKLE